MTIAIGLYICCGSVYITCGSKPGYAIYFIIVFIHQTSLVFYSISSVGGLTCNASFQLLVLRFNLKNTADKLICYQNTDTFFAKIVAQCSLREDPDSGSVSVGTVRTPSFMLLLGFLFMKTKILWPNKYKRHIRWHN
jgi:hypothetical protein